MWPWDRTAAPPRSTPADRMALPVGPVAAIGSALIWSFSTVLFEPTLMVYGARAVNLFKSTIAALLFASTVAMLGSKLPPGESLLWLGLSGLVGLAVGDTAYFAAQ